MTDPRSARGGRQGHAPNPSLELDPVTACRTEFGVLDAFEDSATPLDRLYRGDIVDAADCEDPIQAESPSNALIGYLRASLPTIVLLGVA